MKVSKLIGGLLAGVLAAGVTANAASAKDRVLIRQYVLGTGNYGTIAAVTWQKMVAKQSKSLRMETVQTSGKEQYVAYAKATPEARKNIMLLMGPLSAAAAEKGGLAWPKPVPKPLGLWAYAPNSATALFTNDVNIKTIYDLAGKEVDVRLPGVPTHTCIWPLYEAAGLVGKFNRFPSPSTTAAWKRLGDGVADVVSSGVIDMRLLPPGPRGTMRTRKVYMVHIDESLFAKARAATGLPLYPIKALPGGFRESYKLDYDVVQRKPYATGCSYTPGFFASADMSEETAYELMKLAIDNVVLFGQDHALGKLLPKRIGHLALPQADFHPGAARAYREAGWTYGLEGIEEYNAARK